MRFFPSLSVGRTLFAVLSAICLSTAAAAADAGPAVRPAQAWKAGVARVVITPNEPLWMSGYSARTKPAEGKLQDLYAKALAVEDPAGKRLVLITTDLVGMRAKFTDSIAAELRKRHRLAREQVLFTSSHTHSGPLLVDAIDNSVYYPVTPEIEERSRRYTAGLRAQLIEVVGAALADLRPARLSRGIGRATFAVNRREPTPRGVINGTNPKGPVDRDVPVLRIDAPDGTLRAVVFGYACHNTTLADYQWCGDYAGFAQENLEAHHPGATAMFFMGCGADANPLPRRTVELCKNYGRQLADAVEAVLDGDRRAISGTARAAFGRVELPLDHVSSRVDLDNDARGKTPYMQRRAAMLLRVLDKGGKFETVYPYPIQVWQLGELTWIALGGEAVVDYSLRLKREFGPSTWVAAYANDVMAYIPSLRVLKEGGYEATITSGELAGTSWGPNVEELVIGKTHQLVAEARGQTPRP
jgi:hypothetical protein